MPVPTLLPPTSTPALAPVTTPPPGRRFSWRRALTGATVIKAERRGTSLDLDTTKGRFIVGAHRVYGELVCMGCGEERLTEIVETAGQQEGVCAVCGVS